MNSFLNLELIPYEKITSIYAFYQHLKVFQCIDALKNQCIEKLKNFLLTLCFQFLLIKPFSFVLDSTISQRAAPSRTNDTLPVSQGFAAALDPGASCTYCYICASLNGPSLTGLAIRMEGVAGMAPLVGVIVAIVMTIRHARKTVAL